MLSRERDWCHEERPYRLPASLEAVAKDAGLRFERLTYSYLTLRKDGKALRDHVEGRRVVSSLLRSKGKTELFCCEAESPARVMRLDRHRSESNTSFEKAGRGAILALEGSELKGASERVVPETTARLVTLGTEL